MENKKRTNQVTEAGMEVLSGRAHEYVVNFRHRFLTYFALPLFLLFIAITLLISYTVYVPVRSEYAVTLRPDWNTGVVKVVAETSVKETIKRKAMLVESAFMEYPLPDGSTVRLDCQVGPGGELSADLPTGQDFTHGSLEGALIIYANEERFLFRLLEELAKNIRIKKPGDEAIP